jgi:hypothetical protein
VPEPVDPFTAHDDLFPPAPAAQPVASGPQDQPAPAAPPTAPPEAAGTSPSGATPAAPATAGAPLSDVIVTSDHDAVDLHDPEVRAMLAELMQDEIELACAQRDAGQTLDAILQLTEAEKIAAALARDDRLAEIRALLAELQP